MANEENVSASTSFTSALAIATHLFAMQDTAVTGPKNCKLATAGARTLGITVSKTTATSDAVKIAQLGQTFLTVNGDSVAIAAQDKLKSTTAGIGIKTVTDTDIYGAVALEAATSDGVKILVDIERGVLAG